MLAQPVRVRDIGEREPLPQALVDLADDIDVDHRTSVEHRGREVGHVAGVVDEGVSIAIHLDVHHPRPSVDWYWS